MNIDNLGWGTELTFPKGKLCENSAHVIGGRYPCRSTPQIPKLLLMRDMLGPDVSVLDPFMGSGTTAIEACKHTNQVYGVEIDPYARFISNVSCCIYTDNEITSIERIVARILERERGARANDQLAPKLSNVHYWFDEINFRHLLEIKTRIIELSRSLRIKNFLLAILGDIVRASSKAERQSLKPYISKKHPKRQNDVYNEFAKASKRYISSIRSNSLNRASSISWLGTDATDFVAKRPITIAITSPPYINAMDYTRCIKLESVWIGTATEDTLKDVKRTQLGEQVRQHCSQMKPEVLDYCYQHFGELETLDRVRFLTVVAYFNDMVRNLECVYDALVDSGEYYLIVGNSCIRGVEICTHAHLAKLSSLAGFVWSNYFFYKILNHRTSLPRNNRGGKIRFEHVICLKKSTSNTRLKR